MTGLTNARPEASPLAYPEGGNAWVHRRGLMRTLMDWIFPDAEDHAPISPKVWEHVVSQLDVMSGRYLPEVLIVAHENDERMVSAAVATDAEMNAALVTSLVTACRLYEQLLTELGTAAGLRRRLAGEAG